MIHGRDVVICEPVRTAVGAFQGSLAEVPVADLASTVIRGLLSRTQLDPDAVNDVVLGHAYPTAEAPALGRVAARDAGLPAEVPGMQIDRRCGSGLEAIIHAAAQIAVGASELIIAGGAENMSCAPFYSHSLRAGKRRSGALVFEDSLARGRVTAGGAVEQISGGMVETAENLRRRYGISRRRQDDYALRSQQRAAIAIERGLFVDEIVPMPLGRGRVFERDEHPRPDTTMEVLSGLRAVMAKQDPDATVTAGNASGQNDGASACIVTTPNRAREVGLVPMVRLVHWAVAGVPASTMGIGPVPAVAKLLGQTGVRFEDIGLIELNEAFAVQVLACVDEWGMDDADVEDRLNVNGSGIALGHPVGATAGRILASLAREMRRRDVRYGLETMCIGGGQGIAALFERF